MGIELPKLERRVLPTTGPSVRIAEQAPAMGTEAVAQGLDTAANVGAQVAYDQRQKQEEDAISSAALTFATKRNAWTAELQSRSEKAPLGAPGFTDQFLKDFDADVGPIIQAAPEGRARNYLTAQLQANLRGALASDSQRFETAARTKRITTEQGQAIDQSRIYVRAKPEAFDDSLHEQLAYLDTTGLPADTRQALGIQARESLAASAVESLVERDPRQTLAALRSEPGKSGNSAIEALSPESRERAINLADTEIRRREAEARARQTEARVVAAARSSALKDYLADAHESFAMGFGLPKDYGAARTAIQSLPDDDPRKGILLRESSVLSTLDDSGFMALNPADQEAAITSLEARLQTEGANPGALDMLKLARSIQSETDRRSKADPFQFAVQRGVIQVPPSTGDAAADFKARADAGRQASVFLGRDVPGFTGQELQTIGERYQKGSVDDRMAILGSIVESHGQKSGSVLFGALDAKNQSGMALAGALVMDDPEAARLVVKGQKSILEADGKALVPSKEKGFDPGSLLGDAYGIGTAARATVEDGIKAAYAGLSADAGDASGELDPDRLEQAVQVVTGGLVTYGGRTMPTPKRGVTQEQFSGWAEALNADSFKGVAGLDPQRAVDVFRRDGWLEAIGPNQYAPVIMGPDGRGRYLVDGKGNPLALSYEGGTARSVSSRVSESFGLTPFGPPR